MAERVLGWALANRWALTVAAVVLHRRAVLTRRHARPLVRCPFRTRFCTGSGWRRYCRSAPTHCQPASARCSPHRSDRPIRNVDLPGRIGLCETLSCRFHDFLERIGGSLVTDDVKLKGVNDEQLLIECRPSPWPTTITHARTRSTTQHTRMRAHTHARTANNHTAQLDSPAAPVSQHMLCIPTDAVVPGIPGQTHRYHNPAAPPSAGSDGLSCASAR